MNKKGFTLIELLAVIVILAVIALITAPIVVGIITSSRESANRVSATNYINAVNDAITKSAIDNIIIENGYYELTKDGNVCLDEVKNEKCTGKEIEITANGNNPIKGNMIIDNEVVSRATVVFENFSVELDYDGEIKYKPFSLKYNIGEEVSIDVGTSYGNLDFYVIEEDADTVTLLSSQSMGAAPWITSAKHDSLIKSSETCGTSRCMFLGPITIMEALSEGFSELEDSIIKNYEYVNNNSVNNIREYQRITIKNGETVITDYQGNKNVVPGKTVARLITAEEYLELASIYNKNFTYENLRDLVAQNLDIINTELHSNCVTIEELFEVYNMEDDWLTAYFFSIVVASYTGEALKYSVPEWLGLDGESYWTSSAITLANTVSSIYMIESVTLPSGNVTLMVNNASATDSTVKIRPVIQINKNSKRIQ